MTISLIELLREGGYTIYAKHAEANVGKDLPYLNYQDCLTQRNLSATGKQQATDYGRMLRKDRIPISYPVIASPYCRAIETAQLAFGRNNVNVNMFWADISRLSSQLSEAEKNMILTKLLLELEKLPPVGQNRVIIAHSFPENMGLGEISDMGSVILKPKGSSKGYDLVGKNISGGVNERLTIV